MPIFISRGRYTAESIKGLIANPQDRNEMVAELAAAAAGAKLISYDVTLGKHDFMTIVDAPARARLRRSSSPRRPAAGSPTSRPSRR